MSSTETATTIKGKKIEIKGTLIVLKNMKKIEEKENSHRWRFNEMFKNTFNNKWTIQNGSNQNRKCFNKNKTTKTAERISIKKLDITLSNGRTWYKGQIF